MLLNSDEPIICITSDLDWVNDEILKYMIDLVKNFNINITIFCTHRPNIDIKDHELAIHPYFKDINTEDFEIRKLRRLFPDAIGVRSHTLYIRTPLIDKYIKFGFLYDSSYIYPMQSGIKPFYIKKLIEIPIFMTDYYMLSTNLLHKFNFDVLLQDGIKVFNIHPIHVYLNTYSLKQYEKYKSYGLHENLINTKYYGVRDFFIDLLEFIDKEGIKTALLKEITIQFLRCERSLA